MRSSFPPRRSWVSTVGGEGSPVFDQLRVARQDEQRCQARGQHVDLTSAIMLEVEFVELAP